jgi:hypothetical protein
MQPDRGIIDWQRSFRSHDQNQPLKGEDAEWGSDLVHRFCETNRLWEIPRAAPHVVVSPETEFDGGSQWQQRDG